MSRDDARIFQPYFFHADAVAIAGEIDQLEKRRLARPLAIRSVSCALPSTGGVSESSRSRGRTAKASANLVSYLWAHARTEGRLKGDKAFVSSSARVLDLEFGSDRPLSIAEAKSTLEAVVSTKDPSEFQVKVQLSLSPIEVHGVKVVVEFDELEMNQQTMRPQATGCGRATAFRQASLVREIKISPASPLVSAVNRDSVYIKDVGFLFFGEAQVTTETQRVSLIRFELGCPSGGRGSVGTLGKNGG